MTKMSDGADFLEMEFANTAYQASAAEAKAIRLEAEVKRLKQRNRELEAEIANWHHVMSWGDMSDHYDARDYTFTLYYDQHDNTWVAEAEGTSVNADHPTSHLAALAALERKLAEGAQRD